MENPSFGIVRTIDRCESESLWYGLEWGEVNSPHNSYLLSTPQLNGKNEDGKDRNNDSEMGLHREGKTYQSIKEELKETDTHPTPKIEERG